MKKAVSFTAFFLALLSFGGIGAACGKAGKTDYPKIDTTSYNEQSIKNFAEYKALGIGAPLSAVKSGKVAAAKAYAEEESGAPGVSVPKLVGIKENGLAEAVEFIDDKGETTEQKLNVSVFSARKNFSFVGYSISESPADIFDITSYPFIQSCSYISEYGWFGGNEYSSRSYVLDNRTGKIFDMLNIMREVISDEDKKALESVANARNEAFLANNAPERTLLPVFDFKLRGYYEENEFAYVYLSMASFVGLDNEDFFEKYSGYYEIGMKEEKLFLKKVLTRKKSFDFFGSEYIEEPSSYPQMENVIVDKYGNLYSNIQISTDGGNPYILNRSGEIASLEKYSDQKRGKYLFKALNGIVYSTVEGVTKRVDPEGKIIDSDFVPPQDAKKNYGTKLLSAENSDYYFTADWILEFNEETGVYEGVNALMIYKFTFGDDDTFTREDLILEKTDWTPDASVDTVFKDGKLYFRSDNSIFYYDIYTGKKAELVSDYKFKTLTEGLDGKLYFTGLASNLDDVYGVINADDTVEIDIKPVENNFEIIYVAPLN